ncbi:MAG: helix-turn-helix transcriptional regulator [Proteobacteria bacterium]|nr:helix-turn-helix transcriptional regulator [Pseudomonadota bacterium]
MFLLLKNIHGRKDNMKIRSMTKDMINYSTKIAKHLLLQRIWNDKSQTDIAIVIGVTFQQVQKWENAKNRITADQLFALYDAMNWNIHSITREPEDLLDFYVNHKNPSDVYPEKADFIKRKWSKVSMPKIATLTNEERI